MKTGSATPRELPPDVRRVLVSQLAQALAESWQRQHQLKNEAADRGKPSAAHSMGTNDGNHHGNTISGGRHPDTHLA